MPANSASRRTLPLETPLAATLASFVLLALFALPVHADTLDQEQTDHGNSMFFNDPVSDHLGQVFTPGVTGAVSRIELPQTSNVADITGIDWYLCGGDYPLSAVAYDVGVHDCSGAGMYELASGHTGAATSTWVVPTASSTVYAGYHYWFSAVFTGDMIQGFSDAGVDRYTGGWMLASSTVYNPNVATTDDLAFRTYLADYSSVPTAEWKSWPDGTSSSVSLINSTDWIVASNVPDSTGIPALFDIVIFKSNGSGETPVYIGDTVVANTVVGTTPSVYAIHEPPEYVHATGTYRVAVRAHWNGTVGPFSSVHYTLGVGGGAVPEASCPGDAPFYTSCFWINLLRYLFVPSAASFATTQWGVTTTTLAAKMPFGWFFQVGQAFTNMAAPTSTAWEPTVRIPDPRASSTYFDLTLPFGAAPSAAQAALDTFRTVLGYALWLGFAAYIWERGKGFMSDL